MRLMKWNDLVVSPRCYPVSGDATPQGVEELYASLLAMLAPASRTDLGEREMERRRTAGASKLEPARYDQ